MKNIGIISLCLIGLAASVYSREVPSYLKICKKRDPNLNECVKNSILSLREKLRSGITDLGIPSAEPLTIEGEVSLADSQQFTAKTKNVKIYGIPNIDDIIVNADIDNKLLEATLSFDKLKFEGDYDIKARILVPISATGPIEIDAKDITAKLTLKYQLVQHKGEEHAFFPSVTCKITIGDYTSIFKPIAGQEQTLAEAINNVLNNSKQEILAGIVGSLERGVAKKAVAVANSISKSFTYAQLLPE